MINKLIETLELMNKLKGFKKFTFNFEPQEVKTLYKELIGLKAENKRLQKTIDFLIDQDTKHINIIVKAIKLLKEAGCYDEETKSFCEDILEEELPKLLNILGGDEE